MGNPDTTHTYNHVFTLAFSMDSATEDGSDITGASFRHALRQRIQDLSDDDELCNAVGTPEETERRSPDGNVTTIKHMPVYSHLEMEAALCVWEAINDWTLGAQEGRNPDLVELRQGIGSVELRHASIPLAAYCLKVYDQLPERIRDGRAYDWVIIPAILYTIDFTKGLQPTMTPEEAALAVTLQFDEEDMQPAPPTVLQDHVEVEVDDDDDEAEPNVATEFDICCPGCGEDHSMQVNITALANLSVDGTEPTGDHEWDDSSFIRCDACGWEGRVHQCRAAAIAAAKANAPAEQLQHTPTRRIMAEFVPQAWLNDHAIAVDPQGDTMFDVTDHMLKLGRDAALKLRDDTDDTDALRHLPSAPQWTRDWNGLFVVNVQEEIEAYFHAADTNQ